MLNGTLSNISCACSRLPAQDSSTRLGRYFLSSDRLSQLGDQHFVHTLLLLTPAAATKRMLQPAHRNIMHERKPKKMHTVYACIMWSVAEPMAPRLFCRMVPEALSNSHFRGSGRLPTATTSDCSMKQTLSWQNYGMRSIKCERLEGRTTIVPIVSEANR